MTTLGLIVFLCTPTPASVVLVPEFGRFFHNTLERCFDPPLSQQYSKSLLMLANISQLSFLGTDHRNFQGGSASLTGTNVNRCVGCFFGF